MAFQLGLPVLVLREKGVHPDGVLEKGVLDIYLPEVDLSQPLDDYFSSGQWLDPIHEWENNVRTVARNKGMPPKLY